MKKSRYSEAQIVSILKEAENGVPVPELCRTHGMSSAAFYQWRSKFGGLDWSAPIEWSSLNVNAWWASVLSASCFLALVAGNAKRYAA